MKPSLRLILAMVLGHSSVLGDSLIPVTVRDPGAMAGITGGSASVSGVFAGSAQRILFLSAASDLAANDVNGSVLDLFWRDLATGRTTLVSTNSAGVSGRGQVWDFSVSADGQRVAFTWATDESSLGDTNGVTDIYWRDLETGVTTLASHRHGASAAANARSWGAQISADGRWIVFESESSDLVEEPDASGGSGVFLHDLQAGTSEWISRPPSASVEDPLDLDASAGDPATSADGSVVAFLSNARSLAPVEGHATTAFIWTRDGTGLRRVQLPGTPTTDPPLLVGVDSLTLSADGRVLAFPVSPGGGLPETAGGVWRMDLTTGEVVQVSQGLPVSVETLVEGPVLSADGATLAFTVENGTDPSEGLSHQIRIWRAVSGIHTLKSLQEGGSAVVEDPPSSLSPVLSADGRHLIFLSDAAIPGAGVSVAGSLQWFHRELATGITRRISEDPESIAPGFSPDGRHVLVEERTPVLVPGDHNGEADLVVVSLADGTRNVVSLANGSHRMASGGSMTGIGLSDDGGRLAYVSDASDLVAAPDDPERSRDTFVFDRLTGGNRLLSVGPDGAASGSASESVLARNGRFLADVVPRDGLLPGSSIVCTHLETGTRELVSAEDGVTNGLEGWATEPRISSDGRRVAFRWSSTRDGIVESILYLRDLDARRTWQINPTRLTGRPSPQGQRLQISANAQMALFQEGRGEWFLGRLTNDTFVEVQRFQASNAWLGADGRTVVIVRQGIGASPPGLILRILPSASEELLLPPSLLPVSDLQIAAQGSVIAYVRRQDRSLGTPPQVWVIPVATRVEELVSRSPSGAPGSTESRGPRLSADGRFVTYRTAAPELAGAAGNPWPQVVVTDRYAGTTALLSRAADGTPGASLSTLPQISGDGRWVAFTTFADTLFAGDHNGLGDVALARVDASAPADSDSDGLADGWERDHFGSLDATASADPDGDGQGNADEQAARTSPRHAESVLRLRITPEGIPLAVRWTGAPGARYQLEHATHLNDDSSWTPLGDPVTGYTGELWISLPAAASGSVFFRLAVHPAP